MTQVRLQTLFNEPEFQLPEYKTDLAAAVDLRARLDETITIPAGAIVRIPLGVKLDMTDTPNLCAHLMARSGLGSAGFTLMNGIGLIDPDYQGEIVAAMVNQTNTAISVEHGQRIAQLQFSRFEQVSFETVETFKETTTRGENGHGSTGTH